MKKILIPAILAVTVLVAASFAFMPVQRASTTHASAAGAAAGDITCTGCVGTTDIADGAAGVNTADIAPGAVTTAEIALDTILAADIATGAVATAEILDDTVGAADVAGSDAATGPVVFQDATGTGLTAVTASFTPTVTSQALVICNAFGTNPDATATTAGTLTLAVTTGNGVIQGTAAIKQDDVLASGQLSWSGSWIVTGATTAHTFTCTAGGTGLVDGDTDRQNLFVLWFPE